jgi:four helix bundle protein
MERRIRSIEDFDVYKKAVKLFEVFLEEDLPVMQKTFVGRTLASQQLRSLDSICANMEEGYERKSGKEIKNFFRIAKGSVGESRGRYKRLKSLLSEKIVSQRVDSLRF